VTFQDFIACYTADAACELNSSFYYFIHYAV